MNDEELKNLSPAEQAMRIALSVLGGGQSESRRQRPPDQDPIRSSAPAGDAAEPASSAPAAERREPDASPDGVRRIASRNEIPVAERYVLVMWGLSTYRFDHEMGVTFVVDNSVRNHDAERDFRAALDEATRTAREQGLPYVYLLD